MKVQVRENGEESNVNFVTWIRSISVVLILLCHLAQTNDNAFVVMSSQFFNVGVNIFFILSGFLFGLKGIRVPYVKWYYKRIRRIYIPYWIFLLVLAVIYLLLGLKFKVKNWIACILGVQGFSYLIRGTEHTWFISAILLCYLFTPLFDKIIRSIRDGKNKCWLRLLIVILFFLPVVISSAILSAPCFYGLAYIMGAYWDDIVRLKCDARIAFCMMSAAVIVRLLAKIMIDETFVYNQIIAKYTHYVLGLAIFICIFIYLDQVAPPAIVRFVNKHSFEIYLCHYMFMQPPLSVMGITQSWILNCVFAILATLLAACVLKYCTKPITTFM